MQIKARRNELVREMVEDSLGRSVPSEIMRLYKCTTGDDEFKLEVLKVIMPYCYPKLTQLDATIVAAHVNVSDQDKEVIKGFIEKLALIASDQPKDKEDGLIRVVPGSTTALEYLGPETPDA